jgi:hypothetical protein
VRRYYSQRVGSSPAMTFPVLTKLFAKVFQSLRTSGYFDEAFGSSCVDAGVIEGTLGRDVEGAVLLALRKDGLWPFDESTSWVSEDDFFDMVEFLFDHVSEPISSSGHYHSYADCGWHYERFDRAAGTLRYLTDVNRLLADYRDGFELTHDGFVVGTPPPGLGKLLEQEIPDVPKSDSKRRIENAIMLFRNRGATPDERRSAIVELAAVLEYHRADAKRNLASSDESDLFNIANNFGIRHHNPQQKSDYDHGIWQTWIFYTYLVTLHVVLRLARRSPARDPQAPR